MSAAYDSDLPTNKDFVRFLIGDTDTSDPKLSDEEINAVLGEETATGAALKYYAAARCLETLQIEWLSMGKGVLEKEVSRLRIKFDGLGTKEEALERKIAALRARGAWLLTPTSKLFRVL